MLFRAHAPALGLLLSSLAACTTLQREVGDRFEDHAPSPWTSADACEKMLPAQSATGTRAPRIGTWNLLYFPDASEDASKDGTDIGWLACAIAQLDVDVLVVQEIKKTARSLEQQRALIARLNQLTGGDFRVELARCTPDDVQHPGFLFDQKRVTGSAFRDLPVLNQFRECDNNASPGFAGYFVLQGGPDFHLIAVHLEAYKEKSAFDLRNESLSHLGEVAAEAYALIPDRDVIFAGDFNTTGCEGCKPQLSGADEVGLLSQVISTIDPALMLLPPSIACSKPGGGLLDHFVVSPTMSELAAPAVAQVGGICAESQCSRLREWHEEATEHLSDHCPLTLELSAMDDD